MKYQKYPAQMIKVADDLRRAPLLLKTLTVLHSFENDVFTRWTAYMYDVFHISHETSNTPYVHEVFGLYVFVHEFLVLSIVLNAN